MNSFKYTTPKPFFQFALRTMRLHEYQAASLMLKYNIPVPLVSFYTPFDVSFS